MEEKDGNKKENDDRGGSASEEEIFNRSFAQLSAKQAGLFIRHNAYSFHYFIYLST